MELFGKKEGGIMDVIRCDEKDYLIWKWKPQSSESKVSHKENAIRLGSSLRVKEGSVAVFVYKQKDGIMQDYIVGPFDEIINTKNLPILTNLLGVAYDGNSPFQAEVYFINMAQINQIKFAVPFFDIFDPRFTDFSVPVAVRGTMTYNIADYKEFIKLHRLENFDVDTFKNQIKDTIVRYVKGYVTTLPTKNDTSVIQLEKQVSKVNEEMDSIIKSELEKTFGITLSRFDISDIEINKESEGYIQLKAITQDVTTATMKAQAEANIKNIKAQQVDYEEQLRIKREEGQYAQHMQTRSHNIGVYQTEKQAEVGVAGAEALGKMSANGASNVDLGGNAGMNMAGMMAGMAMGGALGQNMAGMFNNMNQGLNRQVPPPVPEEIYYMAIGNGQSAQYDINGLKNNIQNGSLTRDTLIWKQGMANWMKAMEIPEINALFTNGITPPPMPKM